MTAPPPLSNREAACNTREGEKTCCKQAWNTTTSKVTPSRIGEGVTFDVVVFHACLQHVFSPSRVLQAASRLLRGGGAVIIAQAQGRRHADQLRVKDPQLQPRGLPASPEDVEELIPEGCPLEL